MRIPFLLQHPHRPLSFCKVQCGVGCCPLFHKRASRQCRCIPCPPAFSFVRSAQMDGRFSQGHILCCWAVLLCENIQPLYITEHWLHHSHTPWCSLSARTVYPLPNGPAGSILDIHCKLYFSEIAIARFTYHLWAIHVGRSHPSSSVPVHNPRELRAWFKVRRNTSRFLNSRCFHPMICSANLGDGTKTSGCPC